MLEFFSRCSGGELIALVAVVGGLLIGLASALTAIVGAYWTCLRERQMAADLVRDMLDRGVPPEEIAEIVRATGADEPEEAPPAQLRQRGAEA